MPVTQSGGAGGYPTKKLKKTEKTARWKSVSRKEAEKMDAAQTAKKWQTRTTAASNQKAWAAARLKKKAE